MLKLDRDHSQWSDILIHVSDTMLFLNVSGACVFTQRGWAGWGAVCSFSPLPERRRETAQRGEGDKWQRCDRQGWRSHSGTLPPVPPSVCSPPYLSLLVTWQATAHGFPLWGLWWMVVRSPRCQWDNLCKAVREDGRKAEEISPPSLLRWQTCIKPLPSYLSHTDKHTLLSVSLFKVIFQYFSVFDSIAFPLISCAHLHRLCLIAVCVGLLWVLRFQCPTWRVHGSRLKPAFRVGGGEHVEARDNMTPLSGSQSLDRSRKPYYQRTSASSCSCRCYLHFKLCD